MVSPNKIYSRIYYMQYSRNPKPKKCSRFSPHISKDIICT